MSGRLIILPKKSYCPWNPKNVERVLRDEKKYADEKEQEEKKERLERFRALKDAKRVDGEKPEHVNLFAREERKMESEMRERGKILGQSLIVPLHKVHQSTRKAKDDTKMKKKDEKLKNRMDPMKEFTKYSQYEAGDRLDRKPFVEVEKKGEVKRKRRSSSHDWDSESSTSRNRIKKHTKKRNHQNRRKNDNTEHGTHRSMNIEELRSRRAERENRERERQARLF
jgi:hypothetical protein